MMNASATLTASEYRQQYTNLTQQYQTKKAEYEALLARRKSMGSTAIVFGGILFHLTEMESLPVEFDEILWNTLVDHATVYADERTVFTLTDGTEIVTTL